MESLFCPGRSCPPVGDAFPPTVPAAGDGAIPMEPADDPALPNDPVLVEF